MKTLAKNAEGVYETQDLWYKRLPIVAHLYFGGLMMKCLSLVNLECKDPRLLDFGCGQQRLSDLLPSNVRYAGYDVIPEYSDIKDYRVTTPNIVMAISVLEHLTYKELDDFFIWNKTNYNLDWLVISLPIKNDRHLLWKLFGMDKQIIKEHHLDTQVYNLKGIHDNAFKYLKLWKKVRYFNHEITVWSRI